jgi:hypothetical protein
MFLVDHGLLTRKEAFLLRRLEAEYTPGVRDSVLLPLVTHASPVSLRLLDWAVVNWSKKNNVLCASSTPARLTNVHDAYKSALSYWKRRLFDPFRRRKRIEVRAGSGEVYETTLGQANFALWTYKTGVLSYVLCHKDAIELDMNTVSRQHKRQKREAEQRTGTKRIRTQITPSGGRIPCLVYKVSCTVVFA